MKGDASVGIALLEPEIAGNAGSIARLCAATGCPLHLVGRLGFQLRGPAARRAGMDYWERVEMHRHATLRDLTAQQGGAGRPWLFTTQGERSLWDTGFEPGDLLLFGPESRGLPSELLASAPDRTVRIPMVGRERSLNLSTAAAVGLYEALRQLRGAANARG